MQAGYKDTLSRFPMVGTSVVRISYSMRGSRCPRSWRQRAGSLSAVALSAMTSVTTTARGFGAANADYWSLSANYAHHRCTSYAEHVDRRHESPATSETGFQRCNIALQDACRELRCELCKPEPRQVLPAAFPPAPAHRLRILCLHGFRQTGAILQSRIRRIIAELDTVADFIFLDGPHKLRFLYTPHNDTGETCDCAVAFDFEAAWPGRADTEFSVESAVGWAVTFWRIKS